jgi:hypothetical protein
MTDNDLPKGASIGGPGPDQQPTKTPTACPRLAPNNVGAFTPPYDKDPDAPEPETKLSIEPVRGFRVWYYSPEGRLKSVSMPYFWTPGWNEARCLKQASFLDSDACSAAYHPQSRTSHTEHCPLRDDGCQYPRIKCACGFYAYYGLEYWTRGDIATGVIEGKGRCVIGPRGFRAQHARIIALAVPEGMYYQVKANYPDVPIYFDNAHLLHDHPLTPPASEP